MIYKKLDYSEIYSTISSMLLENKFIGWYQGKSEYGPRALGNRSIFANPTYDNKDYLNSEVKHREWWRPYAPIILEEHLHDYFDCPFSTSPYMLFSGTIKSTQRGKIPAVTHEDGTARFQTVTEEENEQSYNLIKTFYENGGVPLLLNTSFNLSGVPIVETPKDALNTFSKSKLDVLVIHNYLITKE